MIKPVLMKSMIGSFVTLLILICWKFLYPYTCFAWIFPFLIFMAITYGQFEYIMRYRRCRAEILFYQESWMHSWMTKKPLVIIFSIIIAVPFTLSLISFAALATIQDGLFLILGSIITIIFFPVTLNFLRNSVVKNMLSIITKRFTVILTMLTMLIVYSYVSYHYIPIPSYLDLSSIKHTIDTASQNVASLCTLSNLFLKWSQELNAVSWYGMMVGAKEIENENTIMFAWIIFFLKHALVFAGLSRTQVELIEFFQYNKQNKSDKEVEL